MTEALTTLLDRTGDGALSKGKPKRVQKVLDALATPPSTGADGSLLLRGAEYLARYQDGPDIVLGRLPQAVLLLADDVAFRQHALLGSLDGAEGLSDRKRRRFERQLAIIEDHGPDHIGNFNLIAPAPGATDPTRATVLASLRQIKKDDRRLRKVEKALAAAGGWEPVPVPAALAADPSDTALHYFEGVRHAMQTTSPGGAIARRTVDGPDVVWTILVLDRPRSHPDARVIRLEIVQQGDTLTGRYGAEGSAGLTVGVSALRGTHVATPSVAWVDFGDGAFDAGSSSIALQLEIDGQRPPVTSYYQYELTNVQVSSF